MAKNLPSSPADDQPSAAGKPGGSNDMRAVADLIRQKVARLYEDEPDVKQELAEAESAPHRSKHQQFMYELGASGKNLAAIQTEWHNYYQGLSETEKRRVWQEFYASQPSLTSHPQTGQLSRHKQQVARAGRRLDGRSPREIQAAVRDKVSAGGRLKTKHHLQSLLFGFGVGFIVLLVFLLGFFNEVVIAPFIQPGRASHSTPLIVGGNNQATTNAPEVIIPKINVEIPVVYGETSTKESVIENDLQNGVVHYPTTVLPGQTGNAAFFGHSSNNIFNQGKYKFAFVLLHKLVPGDTFYLSRSGTMYVYKVISRKIVNPGEVSVLNAVPGQHATATLITCDPPGTSLNRLVVVGQQVSPDPAGNKSPASTPPASAQATYLPGNGPTLWGRFISTVMGKIITVSVLVLTALFVIRRLAGSVGSHGRF